MLRRNFLGAFGAVAAAQVSTAPRLKPKALRPGDTVGLITPSTYVSDPDRLLLAGRTIEYFGLKAKQGRNVGKRTGYVGGSAQERVDDLHAMFRDPEVKAVFAIRGGYGATRLLEQLDYAALRERLAGTATVLVGHSDFTAIQLALYARSGLVSFGGPMLGADFGAPELHPLMWEHFWRTVTARR